VTHNISPLNMPDVKALAPPTLVAVWEDEEGGYERVYACAECGDAAETGAIDQTNGEWYCRGCWESFLGGETVLEHEEALQSCGSAGDEGCTTTCRANQTGPSRPCESHGRTPVAVDVDVRGMGGESLELLSLTEQDKIMTVKKRIQAARSIPVFCQRLVLGESLVDDADALGALS